MNGENAILTAVMITDFCRSKQKKNTGESHSDMAMALTETIIGMTVRKLEFSEAELKKIEAALIIELSKPDRYGISWEYSPPPEAILSGIPDCRNKLKYYLPLKVYFTERFNRLYCRVGFGMPEERIA
jgi:hypothetical protein